MNNDELKKRIEEFRKRGLSANEKASMLSEITNIKAPVKSPYSTRLRWETLFSYSRSTRLTYVLAAFIIFFMTGGSLIYASEKAIPGDALYPVKVAVAEPLRDVVVRKPEKRAAWEAEKAERRLKEAEALAERHELDGPAREKLERKFEEHSDRFSAEVAGLSSSSSTEQKAKDAKREFKSKLSDHEKKLSDIRERKDVSEDAKKELKSLRDAVSKKASRNDDNHGKGIDDAEDTPETELEEETEAEKESDERNRRGRDLEANVERAVRLID